MIQYPLIIDIPLQVRSVILPLLKIILYLTGLVTKGLVATGLVIAGLAIVITDLIVPYQFGIIMHHLVLVTVARMEVITLGIIADLNVVVPCLDIIPVSLDNVAPLQRH